MPARTKKQKATMQAIAHGWKPRKGSLRKIGRKTATKILGKH